VNEHLLDLLKVADRTRHFDIARDALVAAIDHMVPGQVPLPAEVAAANPAGARALEKARGRWTLARPELLALAELEDDLEAWAATRPREEPKQVGWPAWVLAAGAIFLAILGIAAIPAAARFGGNAWELAALPLACVAVITYLGWHSLQKKSGSDRSFSGP